MLGIMKKIISILLIACSTIPLILSCNFSFTSADLLTKPDVEAKNSIITISIPRQSDDTKYINIYRKDVDDSDENVINIGLIYPSAMDTVGSSYLFSDSLIYKEHTYTYMVRYAEGDEYYYSEWSNEVTTDGGYDVDKTLKYKDNSATFTISETDYTLTLMGDILNPDIPEFSDENNPYEPKLIVSANDKTQVFSIGELTDNTIIPLRGLLPSHFLDTEVTIIGVVAQKTEYLPQDDPDAEPIVKRIFWTEPTEIKLSGFQNKTVYIPSANGDDGVDFSRKAALDY